VKIIVERAVQDDAEAVADLMEELDAFYGAPPTEPRQQRVDTIRRLVLTGHPSPAVILARDGDELVGMASYSFLWPAAGVTQSLFLKELYVRETARRRGVGGLLMQRLHTIAAEAGCSRIEWTTEIDNESARHFYAAQGYTIHEGKIIYRVEGRPAGRSSTGR